MERNITTDPADIKCIIKEHYKQLYAHKLNKLDETEQFLKNHELLKFAQEETDNLHNFITINKMFSKFKPSKERNLYVRMTSLT